MSIGAVPFQSYTRFDNEFNALMAKQNGLSQSNSIFGIQGYPDPLGPNSIFGAGNDINFPANESSKGFGSLTNNRMTGFNLNEFTSLSSAAEEKLVADSSANAITNVLAIKLPDFKA